MCTFFSGWDIYKVLASGTKTNKLFVPLKVVYVFFFRAAPNQKGGKSMGGEKDADTHDT